VEVTYENGRVGAVFTEERRGEQEGDGR
jgi:hypothetical protein